MMSKEQFIFDVSDDPLAVFLLILEPWPRKAMIQRIKLRLYSFYHAATPTIYLLHDLYQSSVTYWSSKHAWSMLIEKYEWFDQGDSKH